MESPLLGQAVAVDLANTLWVHSGQRLDALGTVAGADRWLTAVADLPLADGSTVREAAGSGGPRVRDEEFRAGLFGLRDQVRLLLGATARGGPPAAKVLTAVNQVASAAPSWLQAGTGEGLRLLRLRPPPIAAAVCAALAEDALATAAHTIGLTQCPGHDCLGIFVQDDPRRRYCSPPCSNRTRVARHYARKRPG